MFFKYASVPLRNCSLTHWWFLKVQLYMCVLCSTRWSCTFCGSSCRRLSQHLMTRRPSCYMRNHSAVNSTTTGYNDCVQPRIGTNSARPNWRPSSDERNFARLSWARSWDERNSERPIWRLNWPSSGTACRRWALNWLRLNDTTQTLMKNFDDLHTCKLKPYTHRRRRRDETVLSHRRRRCVHEFATTSDGFGDANAQRSRRPWPSLQYCSQWVTTADWCVHTADATRLDSFVSSASTVCIGL